MGCPKGDLSKTISCSGVLKPRFESLIFYCDDLAVFDDKGNYLGQWQVEKDNIVITKDAYTNAYVNKDTNRVDFFVDYFSLEEIKPKPTVMHVQVTDKLYLAVLEQYNV